MCKACKFTASLRFCFGVQSCGYDPIFKGLSLQGAQTTYSVHPKEIVGASSLSDIGFVSRADLLRAVMKAML